MRGGRNDDGFWLLRSFKDSCVSFCVFSFVACTNGREPKWKEEKAA